jgi:hypothetical protein
MRASIIRIARPTDQLEQLVEMYSEGLDFAILANFNDHEGFDGVILGHANESYHLEFTHHRGTAVGRAPTPDNLLIFYVPEKALWKSQCVKLESAGFKKVVSYNPYWDISGFTYEDLDGYRVVLQNEPWLL